MRFFVIFKVFSFSGVQVENTFIYCKGTIHPALRLNTMEATQYRVLLTSRINGLTPHQRCCTRWYLCTRCSTNASKTCPSPAPTASSWASRVSAGHWTPWTSASSPSSWRHSSRNGSSAPPRPPGSDLSDSSAWRSVQPSAVYSPISSAAATSSPSPCWYTVWRPAPPPWQPPWACCSSSVSWSDWVWARSFPWHPP